MQLITFNNSLKYNVESKEKTIMKNTLTLLLVLYTLTTQAQILRTANWHLGEHTSLVFSKDTVVMDTSAIDSRENNSSISDDAGKLMLYTNGETIWNAQHRIITNGSGISGSETSSRGSVFVPSNYNENTIYLFTTDRTGWKKGFQYHIITRYETDSFVVTSKNNFIRNGVAEPIAAINHQNGKDVWIIVRQYNSKNLLSYLLTKDGLTLCPEASVCHHFLDYSNMFNVQNDFSVSSEGTIFAQTYKYGVEVSLFNNANGLISDSKFLDYQFLIMGIQFSFDNTKLYILSRDKEIIQYSIDTNNRLEVMKSYEWSFSSETSKFELQLTPYGELAFIEEDSLYLSVFTHPDSLGAVANLELGKYRLPTRIRSVGLPNFNFSYFYQPSVDFTYERECHSMQYLFEGKDTIGATSYTWRITNSRTGAVDVQSGETLNYTFVDTGTYKVAYSVDNGILSDTVVKIFDVLPSLPQHPLPMDTAYCENTGIALELDAPDQATCTRWYSADTLYSSAHNITVDTAGIYVMVYSNAAYCTLRDTVVVSEALSPSKPTVQQNNQELESSIIATEYRWYYNGQADTLTITPFYRPPENGYWQVQLISEYGCKSALSDSFLVRFAGVQYTNLPTLAFKVFPNPSDGYITIELGSRYNAITIEVFNIQGKQVYTHQATNTHRIKLDLALAAGSYMLKTTTNNQSFTKPLIIEP